MRISMGRRGSLGVGWGERVGRVGLGSEVESCGVAAMMTSDGHACMR